MDLVLGLVGGLASIVLAAMQLVFGGFEEFRLQNTLIRHFYWTKPSSAAANNQDKDAGSSSDSDASNESLVPEDETEAKQQLVH